MSIDWERLLVALIVMMLVLLLVTVLSTSRGQAASCLELDVPSGAVVSQYDGDTFEIFSPIPPGHLPIRVQGIDTPERKGKQPGWEAARNFTKQWLATGTFHLSTCGKRTFERIEAVVSRNGRTLADDLTAAGHAKPQ